VNTSVQIGRGRYAIIMDKFILLVKLLIEKAEYF